MEAIVSMSLAKEKGGQVKQGGITVGIRGPNILNLNGYYVVTKGGGDSSKCFY